MLRIMAVQRGDDPQREYVLLQNHGPLRLSLRGHLLTDDTGLEDGDRDRTGMPVFTEEITVVAPCVPSAELAQHVPS